MAGEQASGTREQAQAPWSGWVQLQTWVHQILERPDLHNPVDRIVNLFIVTLILLNIFALILGTVASINRFTLELLRHIENVSVMVFTAEYLLRLWSCTISPRYAHPFFGRIRFAISLFAIIDLLAIAPFYLSTLAVDLRFARVLRLLYYLWFGRLGQHSKALQVIAQVFIKRSYELGAAWCLGLVVLLIAASLIYFAKWLQVLGGTESSHIDQGVGHQFHAIVPALEVLKA